MKLSILSHFENIEGLRNTNYKSIHPNWCAIIVAEGYKGITRWCCKGEHQLISPPITIDTVGFDKEFIISAIAKPASTSPPTVFNTINTPFTFSFLSIEINWGITCSYFVALAWAGRTWWPSICPIIGRTWIDSSSLSFVVPNSLISWNFPLVYLFFLESYFLLHLKDYLHLLYNHLLFLVDNLLLLFLKFKTKFFHNKSPIQFYFCTGGYILFI